MTHKHRYKLVARLDYSFPYMGPRWIFQCRCKREQVVMPAIWGINQSTPLTPELKKHSSTANMKVINFKEDYEF